MLGIECIEISRLLNFQLGNAFKYLYRRKDKSAFKQDIEKSIWYLKDASKYPKIIDLSNEDKTIFIKKMAYIISCEEEESVRNIYIKLLDNITYNNLYNLYV